MIACMEMRLRPARLRPARLRRRASARRASARRACARRACARRVERVRPPTTDAAEPTAASGCRGGPDNYSDGD